jgi:solute carrier family 6 amino acid transporter-like protein 5/7/9/14
MLITLGLDSQFALVEAIVTAVCDQWAKQLRKKKWLVILTFCCAAYLLGLTMTTDGGTYVLTFIDTYAGGFNVMLIAILECLSISYAYGGRRFASDIQAMSGDKLFGCIPWRLFRWWWIFCWAFVTPVFVGVSGFEVGEEEEQRKDIEREKEKRERH